MALLSSEIGCTSLIIVHCVDFSFGVNCLILVELGGFVARFWSLLKADGGELERLFS